MSDMKPVWIEFNEGTELPDGTYYCAYGTGPYINTFMYDPEDENLKPMTPGLQILEWKKAPESPLKRVQDYYNEDYTTWHNAKDGLPTEEGMYICRYLHNYRTGLLSYDSALENPWGGNNVVTHYMEVE